MYKVTTKFLHSLYYKNEEAGKGLIHCRVCNQLLHRRCYWKLMTMEDKYQIRSAWFCSDNCADIYILANI